MTRNTQASDIAEFFAIVLNPTATLASLLEGYSRYHGVLNFGHQTRMYHAVLQKLASGEHNAAPAIRQDEVIGPNGEILRSFVENFAPTANLSFFVPGDPSRFSATIVFPESNNEWASDELPAPYRHRAHLKKRPSMEILKASSGSLFISMFGYQYFSEQTNEYWPLASSRSFGLKGNTYARQSQVKDVVVIQDQFDGSNFAHFLYDYVPRVIYFCNLFRKHLNSVIFLMGGQNGPFQTLLIKLLVEKFDLNKAQFYFPVEKEIWELQGYIYVFTDQRQMITHPMSICHPITLRLLRDITSRLPLLDLTVPKLYISRKDAGMRCVSNEEEIFPILKKKGYEVIILSEYDILTQLSLLGHAVSIVGAHGMGLSGIFFSDRVSSLTELFSPVIGSDAYCLVCRAGGIQYDHIVGTNDPGDKLNYSIDLGLFADIVS